MNCHSNFCTHTIKGFCKDHGLNLCGNCFIKYHNSCEWIELPPVKELHEQLDIVKKLLDKVETVDLKVKISDHTAGLHDIVQKFRERCLEIDEHLIGAQSRLIIPEIVKVKEEILELRNKFEHEKTIKQWAFFYFKYKTLSTNEDLQTSEFPGNISNQDYIHKIGGSQFSTIGLDVTEVQKDPAKFNNPQNTKEIQPFMNILTSACNVFLSKKLLSEYLGNDPGNVSDLKLELRTDEPRALEFMKKLVKIDFTFSKISQLTLEIVFEDGKLKTEESHENTLVNFMTQANFAEIPSLRIYGQDSGNQYPSVISICDILYPLKIFLNKCKASHCLFENFIIEINDIIKGFDSESCQVLDFSACEISHSKPFLEVNPSQKLIIEKIDFQNCFIQQENEITVEKCLWKLNISPIKNSLMTFHFPTLECSQQKLERIQKSYDLEHIDFNFSLQDA
ncbi:unnamed protein product [Moneuplotes crassus]|uniref:Uncharacterized protein n=1 Tax=Euplotes crassus TaxID=5936 RepID=A0AAD1Y729_EUPCR|nr:unnamed protein product [Moneuplotes crassus]